MTTYNWAEELIDDAVELDGSFRDIELPCMLRYRRGAPTPDTKDVREHVMRAVERGRLVARDAELRHAPDDHVAWSGPPGDIETAREAAFCGPCGERVPPERLLLVERFSIPQHVVDEVLAFRRAAAR
jgi:hypothetical protein